MFCNPILAWHDAFCSIRSRSGGGSGTITWDVMQGELSKIKKVIQTLPSKQLDIGMVMFAPDDMKGKHLGRVEQFVYRELLKQKPERVNSLLQVRRLPYLVEALIFRCQRELSDPDFKVADADMARAMDITPPAYHRDYHQNVDVVMTILKQYAYKALDAVSIECRAINRRYREAA